MSDEESDIVHKFEDLKSDLTKWGEIVDETIVKILVDFDRDNRIKIKPQFRLKDNKSFLSKCLYRNKNYDDPIEKIEDKVGTRLILLKSSDIYEAAELLSAYTFWNCKTTKNLKSLIEESPREFDYQSVHLVVWPKQGSGFSNKLNLLTCEIQIRTLLQHAFAEVSHDSTYKGPYKNDKEIIRSLSKSIALMEVTDDYFCDIFQLMSDQKRKYRNYLEELIRLFKTLNPLFESKRYDIELTELIFNLLNTIDVPLSELETFCNKENTKLKEAISTNNSHLFQEPIIILIGFYVFNHRSFLKDNWVLSKSSLRQVLNGFGFSSE